MNACCSGCRRGAVLQALQRLDRAALGASPRASGRRDARRRQSAPCRRRSRPGRNRTSASCRRVARAARPADWSRRRRTARRRGRCGGIASGIFMRHASPLSSRRRCTPATSRRYQALASASSTGARPFQRGARGGGDGRRRRAGGLPARARRFWRATASRPSSRTRCARRRRGRRSVGRCAAMVSTEAPFGFTRATLR